MALTYDQIDAHVRKKYIPVLQDAFYYSNPLVSILTDKSKVTFDSGKTIDIPILYGEENSGWYTGLDTFNIDTKEVTTLAEFDWYNFYVNVTLTGEDMLKVEGDEKIISLVETRMENASKTANRKLNMAMYTSGGSKAIKTLTDAIGISGTYGGISKDDYSWWQGNVNATGGAFTMQMLMDVYGDCCDGPIQPDLIITTQNIYNEIWSRVQPAQRGNLENTPTLARIGYTGISFNNATIVVDKYCPAGHIFVLNTEFWKLVVHKKRNMYWTEPKVPINQDAYVRQLLWRGALICAAPRWQGYIANVS